MARKSSRRKSALVQRCPICGTQQPLEAIRCTNCGATLSGVPIAGGGTATGTPIPAAARRVDLSADPAPPASWDEGDADLQERLLPSLPLSALLAGVGVVILVAGAAFLIYTQIAGNPLIPTLTSTPQRVRTQAAVISTNAAPPTNTKPPSPTPIRAVPTLSLPTVTPAPPTATITPTRGPCLQKAGKGDTVYALAVRCGHKHLSIVDVIVQMNALKDANSLQEGQTLQIPWPTPIGGATTNGTVTGTPGVGIDGRTVEPTLPPGVTWYTVKKGDTAISVAYHYHINIKILRDLNPEIQFLQCDFGLDTGGAACQLSPPLGEGQRIRVSAPTPTPSLSPTSNGKETPLPTGTATFNAPYSQSPGDNMMYELTEIPALRWAASGQLGDKQFYLVTVRDKTASQTYTATTRDLFFEVPVEWQPTDGNVHEFEWSVAVASNNDAGNPVASALSTEIRTFTWHSR